MSGTLEIVIGAIGGYSARADNDRALSRGQRERRLGRTSESTLTRRARQQLRQMFEEVGNQAGACWRRPHLLETKNDCPNHQADQRLQLQNQSRSNIRHNIRLHS